MPLRYFQPAQQEQMVPQYTPLPLDAVKTGVAQTHHILDQNRAAMGRFDQGMMDMQSQLTPGNREQVAMLLEDDQNFIEQVASGESDIPFQDMLPMIERRARRAQQAAQPFLQDSQQVQSYMADAKEQWEKGRISQEYYDYMRRVAGSHQGLQYDEDGELGGFFSGPGAVRQVDVNKRISDFVGNFERGDIGALVDDYGLDERFVRQIIQEGHTPEAQERIDALVRAHVLNDSDTRNFIQGEVAARQDMEARMNIPQEEWTTSDDLVDQYVAPHVLQELMPTNRMSFNRNPGYNIEKASDRIFTGGAVMVGEPRADINNAASLAKNLQSRRQDVRASEEYLTNTIRSYQDENGNGVQAEIDPETGKLNIISSVDVNGEDHEHELRLLESKVLQARESERELDSFKESLRQINPQLAETLEEDITVLGFEYLMRQGRADVLGFQEALKQSLGRTFGRNEHGFWSRFGTGIRDREEFLDYYSQLPQETQEAITNTINSQYGDKFEKYLSNNLDGYTDIAKALERQSAEASREVTPMMLGGQWDTAYNRYMRLTPQVVYDAETNTRIDENTSMDYEKADFVGISHLPGQGLRAFYRMPEVDGEERRTVHTAPLDGTYEAFIAAQDFDQADLVVWNEISKLHDAPGAQRQTTATVPITVNGRRHTDIDIQVSIVPRGEHRPTQSGANAMYRVRVPSKNAAGETVHKVIYAANNQEVLNISRNLQNQIRQANAN